MAATRKKTEMQTEFFRKEVRPPSKLALVWGKTESARLRAQYQVDQARVIPSKRQCHASPNQIDGRAHCQQLVEPRFGVTHYFHLGQFESSSKTKLFENLEN